MRCFAVYLVIFVTLHRDVYGDLGDDMAKTIQQCCNEGTGYAISHSIKDCTDTLTVSPRIPAAFHTMCSLAKEQCCKQYFQKRSDCDSGIDMATVSKQCPTTNGTVQECCNECLKGTEAGSKKNPVCVRNVDGVSTEEILTDDAYVKCCKKAIKEGKGDDATLANLPSLCEEFAPNELCAHHCIPVPGSYRCECNPGFMLMADGKNCMMVTNNRCKPRNPCQHKCNDNGKEVKCSCRRGYELMADGKSCQDIDECKMDIQMCPPDSICQNIQGTYRCIPVKNHVEKGHCPPGFSRNLANNGCDDINECRLPHPPCPSYLCENTVGGYRCGGVTGNPVNLYTSPRTPIEDRCPPGFKIGTHEECEDVDECATHKDDCNPLSQFCINTHSSFYCQDKVSKRCPPGFKISPTTNKCEDIDECEEDGDSCQEDEFCINQLGQYDCKPRNGLENGQCPEGMRKSEHSLRCEDIDECVEGTHLCEINQNCLNTNGSYECHCKLGYELDIITGACVDVNECATMQHSCIPQAQRCDNTVGSYICVRIAPCGTGYVLQHSTGQCEDIDECALGTANCGPKYSCLNIRGSFRCMKKAPTTTTASPEYYVDYYDSYDEINTVNSTSAHDKPNVESPSETTSSSTTPEVPSPQPPPSSEDNSIDSPIEPKSNEPPKPIEEVPPPPDTNELDQTNPEEPQTSPKDETHDPNSVEPTYSENPDRDVYTFDNDTNNINVVPGVIYNEPKPPEYIPEEELPKPPEFIPVSEPTPRPTERQPDLHETTYIPQTTPIEKNEDNWKPIKPIQCSPGFELDEYGACFDIDECAINRHTCSGLTEVCKNTMGGHLCICAPGFRRDLVTKACEVITSASTTTTTEPPQTPPPTTQAYFWGYQDYRTVTAKPFRPRNLCDAGFHHNSKTGICEDIDECTNGQANCASVEICVNTEGGYRCECPPNWRLDDVRHRCMPIRNNGQFPTGYGNVPTYQPPPSKDVFPSNPGTKYVEPKITRIENRGHIFKCPVGYRLGDDNTCVDVNECATGEARCGPRQFCTNLPGGYSCNCPSGMRLVNDHECEDVDECALAGSVPVCSPHADCVNTVGSYLCKCHKGFRSAPINDKVCVDVDECMDSRAGPLCQHRCNNVWGGYTCSCHKGYRLNADNSTCSDVDECTEYKSKIPCVGKCVNEPGSYRCTCPSGYRLSEDKRSCIDIDECETGEAPCANGAMSAHISDACINTRGSYKCHRITCPVGYQLENKHRCNKVEKVCPAGDWTCAHQPSTISYNFITFVSNLFIPDNQLNLFTMRGPVWPFVRIKFELKMIDVNAPPSVKRKATIKDFLLTQNNNEGLTSLVTPLEGPQSIELEMTMELYTHEQFGGRAIAKLFLYVSEYEF